MDNKECIIRATVSLINEKGDDIDEITVRDICKRAGVGLGLVNYYFESKDKLIETCVERIINGIVEKFAEIREKTENNAPRDKLDRLGNMTLTFLFEHYAVSRISILTDMRSPGKDDNTMRTYRAYLPLVAECRPDWCEAKVARMTHCLITSMQQAFLRHEAILLTQGVDLKNADERKAYHTRMLRDILGE